ncbi:MAG: transporter, partial [Pseudomonadota bacterium]
MSSDVTGRDRLAKNVSASYLSHIVFIIFGFLLPRMISDRVGQAGLGLWDFSWAFVKYMNLSMIGIGSSVNRYVAQYRTAGDTLGLNKTISTVVAIQCAIAFGV